MWQFAKACEGIKEACKELTTPVVSGNVSLYNETEGVSVFPTPSIAMVGLNESQDRVLDSKFKDDGDIILLVGETKGEFGGSLALKEITGAIKGDIDSIDYDRELKLWDFVIKANERGLLKSAKDLNLGGLAVALGKVSAISNRGCEVKSNLDGINLFDETQSRAIVTTSPEKVAEVLKLAKEIDIEVKEIGKVGGDKVKIDDIEMDLEKLKDIYFNRFKEVIEQDL
jgi:phosphoribosylformylglycinamidine synthase